MVVFLGKFNGVSKKGNEFHSVTLADVYVVENEKGEKRIESRVSSFFTEDELDLEGFVFGSVVEPEMKVSDRLGAAPSLVGLKIVKQSPFDFTELLGDDAEGR